MLETAHKRRSCEDYGMLQRSSRWDSAHADAAVRTLCGHDCRRLEITKSTPVVFEQF